MEINSETKLYGSFSIKAGSLGCKLFNEAFQEIGLNAIYKSFSVSDIKKTVEAAKFLKFSGFAVSMPYKMEVMEYVDNISPECHEIKAANTIINNGGLLTCYNTDIYAATVALQNYEKVFILGNGGYSKAVQYSAKKLNLEIEIITRKNWKDIKDLKDSVIFNCTPVEDIVHHESNHFIDCVTSTDSGKWLSKLQASRQFKLYTGLEYPFKIQ